MLDALAEMALALSNDGGAVDEVVDSLAKMALVITALGDDDDGGAFIFENWNL